MPLSKIRKAVAKTRVEMAKMLGVGQASISKLEHASDMYLGTLRRHVRPLGGELTLAVTFLDGRSYILDALGSWSSDRSQADDGEQPSAAWVVVAVATVLLPYHLRQE
jgi:hypothetical protein